MARQILTELDRQAEQLDVSSHWHLFKFNECSRCKERYVREWGWSFKHMVRFSMTEYVCQVCCPSQRDVVTWAKELEQIEREQLKALMPKVAPPKPNIFSRCRHCGLL